MEPATPSPDTTPSAQELKGYALVADLMRRQDEVLAQLEALNDRVESAIDHVIASRKQLESDPPDVLEMEPKVGEVAPDPIEGVSERRAA